MTNAPGALMVVALVLGAAACAEFQSLSREDQAVDEHSAADHTRAARAERPAAIPMTREDILAGLQAGNIPLSLGALMVTGTR